jgi:hypothetical protein
VQITLRWDDEHAIGLDEQALGNECDRHPRVVGEDFVKEGGRMSQVIDDHDRDAEIGWKVPQQACVRVEAPGGATYANQRKALIHFCLILGSEQIATLCRA